MRIGKKKPRYAWRIGKTTWRSDALKKYDACPALPSMRTFSWYWYCPLSSKILQNLGIKFYNIFTVIRYFNIWKFILTKMFLYLNTCQPWWIVVLYCRHHLLSVEYSGSVWYHAGRVPLSASPPPSYQREPAIARDTWLKPGSSVAEPGNCFPDPT